jgi:hypothetical protein
MNPAEVYVASLVASHSCTPKRSEQKANSCQSTNVLIDPIRLIIIYP